MFTTLKDVALLLAIFHSSPKSEAANVTAFITNSSSPSYAVEGQNHTLVWTYTLDGTVGVAQFTIDNGASELLIGKRFGPGVITVEPEYRARFRAQATNTRAELNILAVQRSDERTFKMNVLPRGSGSLAQAVVLIVSVSSVITELSGNQTVTEGGNATLKCLADGKPMPNKMWTRLSNNSVVNMPLIDIRRQDTGKYRCTADNGIGIPATGDVWIFVQYPVESTGFGVNVTVPEGGNTTFSCPVDGNPKPNISWYRGLEISETPIFSGEMLEAKESGCYTCVASSSLGKPVIITQCLIFEESFTASTSLTASTRPTTAPKTPSRTVIGVAVGVAVFLVLILGVLTWLVCKKKKRGKLSKNDEQHYVEVDKGNNEA